MSNDVALSVISGIFIPFVVGLLSKQSWDDQVKNYVLFGVCLVVTAFELLYTGQIDLTAGLGNARLLIQDLFIMVLAAKTLYDTLLKPVVKPLQAIGPFRDRPTPVPAPTPAPAPAPVVVQSSDEAKSKN